MNVSWLGSSPLEQVLPPFCPKTQNSSRYRTVGTRGDLWGAHARAPSPFGP
jgi:hypothetical protein